MENFFDISTVASICAICYLIGWGCKVWDKIPDKYIPIIVGICGGILGSLGLSVIPSFPASNYIDAIAVGVVSGLASTGTNQVFKQLSKTE